MPQKRVTIKLPDGSQKTLVLDVPEGYSEQDIQSFIESQDLQSMASMTQFQSESEIPQYNEMNLPFESREQQDYGLSEKLIGAGDAGLGIGASAVGGFASVPGILNQLAKEMVSGRYGTMESAQKLEEFSNQLMQQLTPYSPQTEAGQEYMENVGEALAPLTAVAPQLMQAQMARPNIPRAKPPSKKEIINQKVLANQGDVFTQGYKSVLESKEPPLLTKLQNPDSIPMLQNKTVKTPFDKQLIKAGFDEKIPSTLRNYTKDPDKKTFLKMIDTTEDMRFKDYKIAQRNHPLDEVGKNLKEPYDFTVKSVLESGKAVNRESLALKKKSIDFSPIQDAFKTDLEALGIAVDKKWNVDYKGSMLRGETLTPLRTKINDVIDYIKTEDGVNAYKAHILKKYIDEIVDFNKIGQGASKTVEDALKRLRGNINGVLRETSDGYKKANQTYSDAIRAKESFEKLMGLKVDMKNPDSVRALGSEMRKLGSNYAKKFPIEQMLQDADGIIGFMNKYGKKKFKHDIELQVGFGIELDKRFGLQRKGTLQQSQKQGSLDGLLEAGISGSVMKEGAVQTGRAAMNLFRKDKKAEDLEAIAAARDFIKDLEVIK